MRVGEPDVMFNIAHASRNIVAASIVDDGTVAVLATWRTRMRLRDVAPYATTNRGSHMRSTIYFVSLALLAFTGETAFAANPDNGSTLAQRWCTGCHVVSADQVKGTDIAPSFASIADRPDFNVEKLAAFLLEPHPKMPNMALSPEEVKDISAFIAVQRHK
jgi:mono/diheme cytochrome c family protein